MSSNKRLHLLFSGRVQGVGFRYTVKELAEGLGITGSVRNCPDGDVELLAEGAEIKLVELLRAIRSSRAGRHIVGERISWSPAQDNDTSFRILF
jgi:acylphosphatase